jgi:hypothetical protein
MRALLPCACLFFISLTACGGKVVVDAGSGGAGGSGGAPSSSITSSSAIVASSSIVSSSSNVTASVSSSGTGVTCPDPFPGIEAPCPVEGQVCTAPLACCGGKAQCTNGFWKYSGDLCQQPCTPPCGPDNFACLPGTVCVAYIGKITTYQCEKAPCAPGGIDCGCAAPLCAQEGMVCNNIQDGFKVLCDCQGQC